MSLIWVCKICFLWTDVFQSTCFLCNFCTFKTHLPCCLLLELWGAALEISGASPKCSGNKEQMIDVWAGVHTQSTCVHHLSDVAGTARRPSSPEHQTPILSTDQFPLMGQTQVRSKQGRCAAMLWRSWMWSSSWHWGGLTCSLASPLLRRCVQLWTQHTKRTPKKVSTFDYFWNSIPENYNVRSNMGQKISKLLKQ